MAASSVIPNNKVDDSMSVTGVTNGNITPQKASFFDTPKQNLRGLNKPKCIKCGNVARSRCPFQSCKSCCFRADNPCYIHVLKQSTPLPDSLPPPTAPVVEQPSVEAPSAGTSWRLSLLRQLSTTYLSSLRARRPLTGKEAVNINKWRFSKLKEHNRRNLDTESEAFERYLRNVSLLEETLSVRLDDRTSDQNHNILSSIQARLKSKAENTDRERLRRLVDSKLRKLREWGTINESDSVGASEVDDDDSRLKRPKVEELRAERTSIVKDLVDKLIKAQSEEDLESCLDLKRQLFNQPGDKVIETSSNSEKDLDGPTTVSYSLPMTCTMVPIDQAAFSKVGDELSAIVDVAEL